ncbi:MAG: D-alanine--D-alanine ligase [Firmicutes bacterium]|nr:D-alanine--D-alanine ligase [Alicyclobacillaceae bacterium]MCL6497949.1 D-alanine--D-alanine ligase [Bacillota bacterium]
MRVAVVAGGLSEEHAISVASGTMVVEALAGHARYQPALVVIGRDGVWRLGPTEAAGVTGISRAKATAEGVRLLAEFDLAFLALHGRFGEDGTIQGVLEYLGLPYTGSRLLASALAMDKRRAKQWFRAHGLPVPRDVAPEAGMEFPVVVKPNCGGSSVGVQLVDSPDALEAALAAAGPGALVEERLLGREVTCAVLEDLSGEVEALPVIEIVPRRGRFFDFAAKYEEGGADEVCPAPLAVEVTARIQALAVAAHQALGCRHFSRTDMILTADGPVILETNTIPGLTPASLLPKAARAAGMSFAQLVERLLRLAERDGP